MDQTTFESNARAAESLRRISQGAEIFMGYLRGLRRHYHGAKFGTPEEHERWLALAGDTDPARAARGRGYHIGFEGRPVAEIIGAANG